MSEYKSNPDDYKWHTVEEISNPSGKGELLQVRTDLWWVTNDKGEVALWEDISPQANAHRKLAERFAKSVPGGVGVTFIPVAFLKHNCKDYD